MLPGVKNRTAFRGVCNSAELSAGDDRGVVTIDDGADNDPREEPGRNRDIRVLNDVSEMPDCGVDGVVVDVTVVDDTDADRPDVLLGA